MAIDDHINYEKLKFDINREASKISALWSGKNWKVWISFTGEEILPSAQKWIIEQAKFTLVKAFEKQAKTIEDQRKNNLMLQTI